MKLHRFLFLSLLISVPAEAIEYSTTDGNRVVRPFGIPSRQPPALAQVITIPEVKLSITASQVCGYTDWTSVQLDLPKKLLSKSYWEKIGTRFVDKAKQAAYDITYALPGMIMCNVSPTYCHVFNQAEMMASYEGELTLDTCKIVDGVANISGLQHEDLRLCIEGQVKKSGMTASEARERCLTNEDLIGGSPKNQADAISKAREKGGLDSSFNLNTLLDKMFPTNIQTTTGWVSLSNGGHLYSRRSRSAEFFRSLFPGIEVRGSAMVRNGGTFQPVVENQLLVEENATRSAVIAILKEMQNWHRKGYNARDVLKKSEMTWANKEKWKTDKQPSPIYRPTIDGSEPAFVIQPEQIYSLLPMAEQGIEDNQALLQVIDRLSQSAAYLKVQDSLFDIQTRAFEQCESPDQMGLVAQENCQKILQKTKISMEFLEHRMLAEERAVKVQNEISGMIEQVKASQARRIKGTPIGVLAPGNSPIPLPNSGG